MNSHTDPLPRSLPGRVAILALGVVAYTGFHAVFLSMISFLNGGPLPWPEQTGAARPLAAALVIDLGWVVLFGLQHAVMARPWFKQRLTRVVAPPIERSLFVVATVLCLGSALAFWQSIPGTVFCIASEPVRALLYGVQAAGWGILVWSTFLIDHFELFGLRQVWCAFGERALPVQRFRTPALYRFSRHPMMVGLLLGLWATPDMTWDRLVFALGFSVYIVLGVRLEERDLVRTLGDDYRSYRDRVARFLPLPWRRGASARTVSVASLVAALALGSLLAATASRAQMQSADLSPDISIAIAGVPFHDDEVVALLQDGTLELADLGGLPAAASVDAYHLLPNGDELFSLDTPAKLAGGLTAQPGDVVRWDGASYALEFDASSHGLPAAVDTDAVSRVGALLLLSFDVDVKVAGQRFADEDVVAFDGSELSLYLDGGAAGIPGSLDLDGLHAFTADRLGMSFDASGRVDGIDFDDEDVLLYDRNTLAWSLRLDSSADHESWRAADLEAVHFVPEPRAQLALATGFAVLCSLKRPRDRSRKADRRPRQPASYGRSNPMPAVH